MSEKEKEGMFEKIVFWGLKKNYSWETPLSRLKTLAHVFLVQALKGLIPGIILFVLFILAYPELPELAAWGFWSSVFACGFGGLCVFD